MIDARTILDGLRALSGWEAAAVVLAVAYLVLAARESLWCWAAAFASTLIYLVLFFRVHLYLESVLQVFYLAMAVYGWHRWRTDGAGEDAAPVVVWPLGRHVRIVVVLTPLVLGSGYLLVTLTDAALPYLDAFTTWFSVVATYMVTRKVLENWAYWFVIDSVSIYLYVQRGLLLTAVLFGLYLVLIVFGYARWRGSYRALQGPG